MWAWAYLRIFCIVFLLFRWFITYLGISTITYLQHFSVLSLYMMNVYTSYFSFWNLWANARLLQKIWFVFTRSIHCKKRLIPCFYSCQDREGVSKLLAPSSDDPPSPFYIFVLNSDLMTEQPKQNYPRWCSIAVIISVQYPAI